MSSAASIASIAFARTDAVLAHVDAQLASLERLTGSAGGFPAAVPADAPIVAITPANQPICDALLAEAAKRENVYAARAYRNAAVKVAGSSHNLFCSSPDGVEDAWVDHHLGEKTGLFVHEFVALTRNKNAYDNGRNPHALFPYVWGGLLEDDVRIELAIDILNDLLEAPLQAMHKFHASARYSDYVIAYTFYSQYKSKVALTWVYNNIMKMVMNMCG